jgi:molybdopterin converting factor small subunit
MPIRVILHGRFRIAAGSDQIEIPDTVRNVGDLLEQVTRRLGSDASDYVYEPHSNELSSRLVLLVNGHSVRMLEGIKTRLTEVDTVTIDTVDIMAVVGGG